jgi:hypothetical protein
LSTQAGDVAFSRISRLRSNQLLGVLNLITACALMLAGSYCGSPAALKLLILEEESAAAILNEVRLCLKLNHKNLVRLLDCAVVSTSSSGQPGNPQVRQRCISLT